MQSIFSFDWQVLKAVLVKFPAFSLDEIHHLLVMLFCKNARENLDAINAKSAVYF